MKKKKKGFGMSDQDLREFFYMIGQEIKELREAQKLTDEQLKKTDEQLKKTDEQLKKTDEQLKKLARQVGSIANNQGAVAEEYFYNSLKRGLKLLGMQFDDIGLNWRRSRGKIEDEFDIILINKKNIALIEVKYKAHERDVLRLQKKVSNFKTLFPEYADYDIYAGVAAFHIYPQAKELAKERGYFILQRRGDVIEEYSGKLKAA